MRILIIAVLSLSMPAAVLAAEETFHHHAKSETFGSAAVYERLGFSEMHQTQGFFAPAAHIVRKETTPPGGILYSPQAKPSDHDRYRAKRQSVRSMNASSRSHHRFTTKRNFSSNKSRSSNHQVASLH